MAVFYPENAREVNFKQAREDSVKNHEKDMETRHKGNGGEDRIEKTQAVEVINPVAETTVEVETDGEKSGKKNK